MKATLFFLALLLAFPLPSLAVEVAARITDREIVERLARLEEGQKALVQRIDALNQRINELRQLILRSFGVTFAGMFALVGFVIWDRRSALALS